MTRCSGSQSEFSKVKMLRKYDVFDLICISLFNAVIFGSGLFAGWFIWCFNANL